MTAELFKPGAEIRSSKRARMTVSAPLPLELRTEDVFSSKAVLDTRTGYCVVLQDKVCYGWSYREVRARQRPIFSLTRPQRLGVTRFDVPFSTMSVDEQQRLVGIYGQSYGSAGLASCSTYGEVRYWEAVTDPSRFLTARLPLTDGDTCKQLVCVEPVGFAVLTRLGRVHLVSPSYGGGDLSIVQLARPSSSLFSRVTSLLSSTTSDSAGGSVSYAGEAVVLILSGVRTDGKERDLFVQTATTLQHWELSTRRSPRLVRDISLRDIVSNFAAYGGASGASAASALQSSDFVIVDAQSSGHPGGPECAIFVIIYDIANHNIQ